MLGIDPGITACGWAVVKDHQVLELGTVRTRSREKSGERVRDGRRVKAIGEVLRDAIARHGVVLVAVEHQAGAHRGRSRARQTNAAAQKTQLVEGLGLGLGPEVVELEPRTAKKLFTGSGTASKDRIKAMVRARGVEGRLSEHAADAVAIAEAGLIVWRRERMRDG